MLHTAVEISDFSLKFSIYKDCQSSSLLKQKKFIRNSEDDIN